MYDKNENKSYFRSLDSQIYVVEFARFVENEILLLLDATLDMHFAVQICWYHKTRSRDYVVQHLFLTWTTTRSFTRSFFDMCMPLKFIAL